MSKPITFRLDLDSPAGQVFTKWRDAGYEQRAIIESALLNLDGVEPPILQSMNDNVVVELRQMIERLERAVERLSRGGVERPARSEAKADETSLDPQFVAGMKKVVRPPVVRSKE